MYICIYINHSQENGWYTFFLVFDPHFFTQKKWRCRLIFMEFPVFLMLDFHGLNHGRPWDQC